MVAGKKERLQLRIQYQHSGSASSGLLEKRRSIRSSSNWASSKQPKCGVERGASNEPELRGDGVNGETESHLLRKRETTPASPCTSIERIAGSEKIRIQVGEQYAAK